MNYSYSYFLIRILGLGMGPKLETWNLYVLKVTEIVFDLVVFAGCASTVRSSASRSEAVPKPHPQTRQLQKKTTWNFLSNYLDLLPGTFLSGLSGNVTTRAFWVICLGLLSDHLEALECCLGAFEWLTGGYGVIIWNLLRDNLKAFERLPGSFWLIIWGFLSENWNLLSEYLIF